MLRTLHRPRSTPAAVVALAVGVAGCGDDSGGRAVAGPRPGTYVGEVRGLGTSIALVTDGRTVGGYLCDDTDFSSWLVESAITDGRATLTNRRGKRVGSVTFAGGGARGEVTVPGGRAAFSAKPGSGDAGLYRGLPARGEPTQELGTIVFPVRKQAAATRPPGDYRMAAVDAAASFRLALTWIIRSDGGQVGTVARLSGPLPPRAVGEPFSAGVRYPAIVRVIGSDDVDRGAAPDASEPDVELLAGTRFRVARLGPDDLGG